jgi:AAA+ ATPase superfamily predicted ATPase
MDTSVLTRELPFGESLRSTKKTMYRIADSPLRFWFRVYSPHRSRWRSYSSAQKRRLIHEHAATVFEDFCRSRYPGAQRYWESGVEFDLVAPDPTHKKGLLVAEVKWRRMTAAQREGSLEQLKSKWGRCSLRSRHDRVRFEVLEASTLESM